MRYTVDRIEGEYAVLENENKEMVDVLLSNIGFDVFDGMFLGYEDGKYFVSENDELINEIIKLKNEVWNK